MCIPEESSRSCIVKYKYKLGFQKSMSVRQNESLYNYSKDANGKIKQKVK